MATAEATSQKRVGSVFDLAGKSIELVKNNWQMFAVVNILSLISAFFAIFGNDEPGRYSSADLTGVSASTHLAGFVGATAVVLIILLPLSVLLYAMATSLQLRASKGEKPDFDKLFNAGKKYFLRMFGLLVLMGLIIITGLILLIVPGLFALGRLIFAPYLMVEKNLGVVEALKASNELAKGRAGEVWSAIGLTFLIGIIASIISSIPAIGPLIGAAISIAYSLIIVLRYQEIKKLPKVAA